MKKDDFVGKKAYNLRLFVAQPSEVVIPSNTNFFQAYELPPICDLFRNTPTLREVMIIL